MKLATIDKMKIYYPDEETEIETWVAIIKKNHFVLDTSVDSTIIIDHNSTAKIKKRGKNTFIVNQFDDFFDYELKQVINNRKCRKVLNQAELMPAIYLLLLLKRNSFDEKNSIVVHLPKNLTEDDLYSLIAFKYFDNVNQFTELSTFLKTRKNQEQIVEWFQKKERFNAYNYLLENIVMFLKENDIGFFTMLDNILYKIDTNALTSFLLDGLDEKEIFIPQVSLEQTESLFLDFLKQINAPKEWFALYFFLKKQNYITYEQISANGKNDSNCYLDKEDQIRKLKISDYDNPKTFLNLVHEFIHEVAEQNGESSFSLSEFPSIYYERKAGHYLIAKGYDPKTVKCLLSRTENNYGIYFALTNLFLDISHYDKEGPISREEKIAHLEKKYEAVMEARKEIMKIYEDGGLPLTNPSILEIEHRDYGKEIDEECDYYMISFLSDGLGILNGYQYLIADYLAQKILESKNQDVEQVMIEITTNLPNYGLNSVLERLNLTSILTKEETDNELAEAIHAY